MRKYAIAAALALAIGGVGCGGGGSTNSGTNSGSTTSTSPSTSPQGVYTGSATNGTNTLTFEGIVLPNNKLYAIYGYNSNGVLTITGFVTGQGSSTNTQYTVSSLTDYYYTGQTLSGSLSATYVAGQSISGTLTESGSPSTQISGTVPPASSFDFNKPATLSDITGQWSLTSLDGRFLPSIVNADGTFAGGWGGCGGNNPAGCPEPNNCAFNGRFTPDTTKNFFNLTVSFVKPDSSSTCSIAGQTGTGAAVVVTTTNTGQKQLLVGMTTSTYGTFVLGNR